jgi:hypothetical protein
VILFPLIRAFRKINFLPAGNKRSAVRVYAGVTRPRAARHASLSKLRRSYMDVFGGDKIKEEGK